MYSETSRALAGTEFSGSAVREPPRRRTAGGLVPGSRLPETAVMVWKGDGTLSGGMLSGSSGLSPGSSPVVSSGVYMRRSEPLYSSTNRSRVLKSKGRPDQLSSIEPSETWKTPVLRVPEGSAPKKTFSTPSS
jgi:hypothetical protein